MILVFAYNCRITSNLVHSRNERGAEPLVHRNDALSAAEALTLQPQGVLLSPGPCTPNEAGICLELLATAPADLPILGGGLGHQGIGQVYGGQGGGRQW